jgi:hypothetical protein
LARPMTSPRFPLIRPEAADMDILGGPTLGLFRP